MKQLQQLLTLISAITPGVIGPKQVVRRGGKRASNERKGLQTLISQPSSETAIKITNAQASSH
jgi:hypothetical protein